MILGVGGAGKTCVLESLKTRFSPMPGLAPAQIVPTVGLNLARLEVPAARGGAETCVFWDLGGAPGLRGIWERYYAECDGVLFVVDAALSAENTAAENTDAETGGSASVLKTAASLRVFTVRVMWPARRRSSSDGASGGLMWL